MSIKPTTTPRKDRRNTPLKKTLIKSTTNNLRQCLFGMVQVCAQEETRGHGVLSRGSSVDFQRDPVQTGGSRFPRSRLETHRRAATARPLSSPGGRTFARLHGRKTSLSLIPESLPLGGNQPTLQLRQNAEQV